MDRMNHLKITLIPEQAGLRVSPGMEKTRKALEKACPRFGLDNVLIDVTKIEGLPEEKGYASSTADILGALFGVARLAGYTLTPEEATGIALSVEPTDSLAWSDLVLLDHREGRIMRILGKVPPLDVLVIEQPGTVDTEEFNRKDIASLLEKKAALYTEAFDLLYQGIREGNTSLIGRASTMSALASTDLLEKDSQEYILDMARSFGCPGICTAHSGTLTGVLIDKAGGVPDWLEEMQLHLMRNLPSGTSISLRSLVPGGPLFMEGSCS
jgi:L-threonine kinase